MRSPHSGAGARLGRLNRVLAPLLTLSLLGVGAAACSTGSDAKDGKVTLSVNLFGDFGFEPLYAEYKKTHPNIEIVEKRAEYAAHHTKLVTSSATGAGAADIEAIEVGYINTFTAQPDKFVNLADHGFAERESSYLPWKWKQGLSKDGSTIIGAGTDVGGMAMAYRVDLFEQAGLPTDRDEVSKLWDTEGWQGYLAVGKQFKAKVPGKAWFESSGNMFRAMIAQAPEGMYDKNDQIIAATNPAVKAAFDTSVEAVEAGMSAKLAAWTPEWTAGFDKGAFATIVAPAWMLSYIETNAPKAAGKWDVATVPGGGGNMGGSHLAIPEQSKHQKEAAELVAFLTAPEQQLAVFKKTGNFPSLPALYDTPDIQNFSKAYFNNAPLGKIYSAAAKALEPQYLGPKDGDLMTAVGQGLGRVEDKKQTGAQAWEQALKDVEKLK